MQETPTHLQLLITYWVFFGFLSLAAIIHVIALRWAPNRAWAMYHSIVATISVIFCLLVLWLISGRELGIRIWVSLVIQTVVYPAVWILPAALAIARGRKEHAAVHELVEAVKKADEISSEVP